ncbi:MAG: peptide deformylase [Oscillospiraceae bacterium]|nr:peptide deformylase [Oscillospiraceae bacterium]
MATRRVVMFGEDGLKKQSREISVFDDKLWVLLDDMEETMKLFGGVGIAAPQIGILRRVVLIEMDGELYEFVNPVVTSMKGKQRELEGCLSSPGEWGYVVRPERIKVKAQTRYGEEFNTDADGVFAIALCHEIDHLNGIIFTDIADEMVDDEQEIEKAKAARFRKRNKKKKKKR